MTNDAFESFTFALYTLSLMKSNAIGYGCYSYTHRFSARIRIGLVICYLCKRLRETARKVALLNDG